MARLQDLPDRVRLRTIGCASIVLLLLLRLPYLAAPLSMDEAGDSLVGRHLFDTAGSLYGRYWLDRPPVLVLLYHLGGLGGPIGTRALGALAAVALLVLVMLVARVVDGPRAAFWAAPIAACFLSNVVLGSVITDAEMLAAVPAALAVLLLLTAVRVDARRPTALLAGAGVLAATAMLVKQSSGDAVVAGIELLVVAWSSRASSGYRWRWPVAFAAGIAAPVACAEAWAQLASIGASRFTYAMLGFRVDALRVLARDTPYGLLGRLGGLLPGLIESGILLLVVLAAWQLRRTRRDDVQALTLVAWLVGGAIGVLGGGYYEAHYFIQLVPVLSVLGGIAIARRGSDVRPLRLAIGACAIAVAMTVVFGVFALTAPSNAPVTRVSRYLRNVARPGASVYVMYAKPNLVLRTHLTAPFPYQWSSMMRVLPDAEPRLRAWLAGPDRPDWVVEWERPRHWNLDRSGQTRQLLTRWYREVAVVCDVPILERRDRPGSAGRAAARAGGTTYVDDGSSCTSRAPSLTAPQRRVARLFTSKK